MVVHLLHLRALLSFHLNLLRGGHHEVVAAYALQHAFHLFTLGVHNLYVLTDKVDVLLRHLERLSQAGRAYLEFVVLCVSADMLLDIAAQLNAVLYPHAVGMVLLYHDAVIWANLNVYQEIVLVLEPLFYYTLYNVFVYHTVFINTK